mmetsp:Transcript_48415/g.112160  ORF Transcript_48415/g.112160 Transcript_48415/m.112160 type:complete len:207 (-) Transcript_48415:51-671(-)
MVQYALASGAGRVSAAALDASARARPACPLSATVLVAAPAAVSLPSARSVPQTPAALTRTTTQPTKSTHALTAVSHGDCNGLSGAAPLHLIWQPGIWADISIAGHARSATPRAASRLLPGTSKISTRGCFFASLPLLPEATTPPGVGSAGVSPKPGSTPWITTMPGLGGRLYAGEKRDLDVASRDEEDIVSSATNMIAITAVSRLG